MRKWIGEDVIFMVDANYSMSVEQANEVANACKKYNICWFEELTISGSYKDCAEIVDATSVPLVMGENLHTIHEFEYVCEQLKLLFFQPDASNFGE